MGLSGQWSLFAKMVAVKFFPHDSDYPMIYPIELAIFSWHFPEKSLENEETYGYIHLYPNDSPLFSGDDGHYIHNGVPTSIIIHFYYYSYEIIIPYLIVNDPLLLLPISVATKNNEETNKISIYIPTSPIFSPMYIPLFPYFHPFISHYSH